MKLGGKGGFGIWEWMEKSDNEISWDLLGLKCQKNL